jgi:hypothetical protein
MRTVRNIALALGTAGALVLGSAAFAQDAAKPEAKPDAKPDTSHPHRSQHGMDRMRGMRDNCQGGAAEHKHS